MTTRAPHRTTPDIASFVSQVRAHLSDLSEEEREELVGGLEADLVDHLADPTNRTDLGDPAAYAAELRLAAGLPEHAGRRARLRVPRPPGVEDLLDQSRARFDRVVEERAWSRATWDVVRELRPVWWVARAWIAVTLLDLVAGDHEPLSLVPSLGHPATGAVLLAAAVVVSVLVGLGRPGPGPGGHRHPATRLVTLAVNVGLVVTMLSFGVPWPGYLAGNAVEAQPYDGYRPGFNDGARSERRPGLQLDDEAVTNVFAYDAQGLPLQDVQLFDQDGDPLAVASGTSTGRGAERRVPCPALDADTELLNVFPLDEVQLRTGRCTAETTGRSTPLPPLARARPVPVAPVVP
ncbi:hypothetical protein FE634_20895 [Nocardioides dongxiaopingii]|uniref:HAAS signaling domain-containing protein n=1 Tax=Nocardioides sp. S-1144 TaxID=2582905 RepID=UPI00110DF4D2|nr:hypothetical protein [Nocardioides sp. S-1144]QCW52271.1 hypothetical protein FE634_20895 [Nocardioides sp. S-1144]